MYSYPTPGTKRGLHGSASCYHNYSHDYVIRWLKQMGIGWFKVLDDCNGSSIEICRALVRNDIFPIVRLYRPRPNAKNTVLSDDAIKTVKALVNVGVKYFEPNNEPNLPVEWDNNDWNAPLEQKTKWVVDNWIIDAQRILGVGGLPGFPALAQCAHTPSVGSIIWYNMMILQHMANNSQLARQLFDNGAWVAAHDATLNHCYKDENGVWRFDYPYDPIAQRDKPGITVMADDCSAIGHRVPLALLKKIGIETVAISTEGGVFVPKGGKQQWDKRYPPIVISGDGTLHDEATVAMFEFYNDEPNFLAMCPWLMGNECMGHFDSAWTEDVWFKADWTPLPVVYAMIETATQNRLSLDDVIRDTAWRARNIPFNPDAAFPKYAREKGLGVPMTPEVDVVYGGKTYRLQGFANGIVYAIVGQWHDTRHLSW